MGYEQQFGLVDLKLGLGLSTVAIACGLYLLEKTVPFKDSYWIIAGLVALYFAISGVLYFLTKGPGYKNNKYIGQSKTERVAVFTDAAPFDPVYKVKIVVNDGTPTETAIPFLKMFDSFGFLNEAECLLHLKAALAKKKQ